MISPPTSRSHRTPTDHLTYPNSSTNSFGYNGFDTRISKTDSGGTSTYRRIGTGVTAPVLGDGSASYTPGLSERTGSTTTFQHSGIKNADAQSGTGQTLTASRIYDAFGNVDSSTGTFAGYFGYGGGFGYQSDADSSLKLLGHRYYDSSTGRFLTRDRVKDGRNWYAYSIGSPVNFADPTGLTLFVIDYGYSGLLAFVGVGGSVGLSINLDEPLNSGIYGGGGTDVGVGLYAATKWSVALPDGTNNSGWSDTVSSGIYTPAGCLIQGQDNSVIGIGTPAIGIGAGLSSRRTYTVTALDGLNWLAEQAGSIVEALLRTYTAPVW